MAELESTLLLNENKTGEECDIVPSTKLSPAWEWKPLWLFYVTSVRACLSLRWRDWVGSTNITDVCGRTIFLKESGRFTVIFIIHNTNKCNFPSSFGVTQNTRLYCFTLQAMSQLAWFLVRLSIPDCPPVLVCTYSGFNNRDQFWAPQIQNMWRTRWGPKRADS